MKILVTCKRVPNPEHKLKIAGGKLDLAAASWQLNTFDEYAVETALRLTEKGKGGERSGEVVAVSIGPKEVGQQLRGVLAMGADRAILVGGDDAALDALATARVLAAVVAKEKPDLVVLGKQTVDGDSNQVGQILAGLLGWPQATFLASIKLAADGKSATVTREVDAGVEEKRVRLPAVVTVDLRIIGKKAVRNEALAGPDAEWEETQRYASLKGIMAAKKKEIKDVTLAELGVDAKPAMTVTAYEAPPVRKAGAKVASVDELVAKLHNEAKVILMPAAVVVFCESDEKGIRSASLPALTAGAELAKQIGGDVVAVVIGAGLGAAAADAAKYAARVLAYDGPGLAAPLAETWAPQLADAVKRAGATALLGTATSTGKDLLPRAAALLGAGMASDITAVLAANRFKRPAYAGNAIEEVTIAGPVIVASVRQTAFPHATAGAGGAVETVAVATVDALGAELVGLHATQSARPDLGEAKVVVSGGRGMREGANFKVLEELTDLLGGALGASRAACDAGMVPNDLQVGQTGKVVAPQLYIAVAISGAIQHLAGMKGSKVIVAINKDPEAPIFQVADYGLVDTWEKAIPPLIAAVKKLKAGG